MSVSAPAAAASRYSVVDTLPAFFAFWSRAEARPLERQRALFHELVVAPHPELFVRAVVGRTAGTGAFSLDERLREWLPGLPALIPTMRRLSAEIAGNLARYDRSFRAAFPDFAWRGTVYFTVSLDAFDGTVRPVKGQDALIFGVDKIARIHGAQASLEPLFHHELFHLYHDQVMRPPRDDRTLLYPLWCEGLAVYVARALNPAASWTQLVLSDELVQKGTARLPALAAELRPHLQATTEADFRDFFLGAGTREDIPRRVGYLVGLRVVEHVAAARKLSLRELARLRGPELLRAVDDALAALAAGGPGSPAAADRP